MSASMHGITGSVVHVGSALSLGMLSAAGAPTGGYAAPSSVPPVRAPAALEKFPASLRTVAADAEESVRDADPTNAVALLSPSRPLPHQAVQGRQLTVHLPQVALVEPGQPVGELFERQVVGVADLRKGRLDPATALKAVGIAGGIVSAAWRFGIRTAPAGGVAV